MREGHGGSCSGRFKSAQKLMQMTAIAVQIRKLILDIRLS